MRKIWSAHHGLYLPVGGWRPSGRKPRLRYGNYIKDVGTSQLPSAPPSCDYSPKAMQALSKMYLNDQFGCCVVAALSHWRGVTSANAGSPIALFSDDDIRTMYRGMSGGVFDPSNPSATDEGCDEITAIGYGSTTGFTDGVKIAATMAVDATNWEELCTALWLFEGGMDGQGLPAAWVSPMPSPGTVWDVAGDPVPTNGHATYKPGYTSDGKLLVATWGMIIQETQAAQAKYSAAGGGGEFHVMLSPDVIDRASQKSPTGFDFDQLRADIGLVT